MTMKLKATIKAYESGCHGRAHSMRIAHAHKANVFYVLY